MSANVDSEVPTDLDPAKLASQRVPPPTIPRRGCPATRSPAGGGARPVLAGAGRSTGARIRRPDLRRRVRVATRIALLAESQNHHPVLEVAWGRLTVNWTTDAIGTLSANDLIMAAKVDRLVARGLALKD